MTKHRYPLADLISASGLSYDYARQGVGASGTSWTLAAREGLSEAVADRWACKLGLLALAVWPEMVDHQIAEVELECAAEYCSERFVPPLNNPGKRWCSPRCRTLTAQRRYRATELGKRRNVEGVRRYRQEVAEMIERRAKANA